MAEVTIIADDLTGAADCGLAFQVAGLSTFVAASVLAPLPAAQVISLDLDSRHRPAEEAARRSHAAARAAWHAGSRILYKKIDSTLRGNVGVEVAATVRGLVESGVRPAPLVIAAPAFPGTGRVTVGGRVVVLGVPLAETEPWRSAGIRGPSDLPSMLSAAGLPAVSATLGAAREGAVAFAAELTRLAGVSRGAVVCDAETEEDLGTIAAAGARLERPVLWVGSAGLARHLPRALSLRPAGKAAPLPRRAGSVLIVVGSRSREAREQAQRLSAEPWIETIEIAPEALLRDAGDVRDAGARLRAALAGRRDVLVVTGLERILDPTRAVEIAAALGRLAAAHAGSLRGIVATGGDVARAVLDALGARGLHLRGEVEQGVPLGLTDTDPPMPMVTKAGAFGTPATLQRCRAALRTEP